MRKFIFPFFLFLFVLSICVSAGDWQTVNTTAMGNSPFGLSIGDFDSDGLNDMVVGYNVDDTIYWLRNDNNDTFTPFEIAPFFNGVQDVFAINIDKDGWDDVVACGDDGGVRWYENDGDDTFTEHNLSTERCGGVTAGDIDGDSDYDIIAGELINDDVVYFENLGDENFVKRTINLNTCNQPAKLRLYDINVDGYMDVVVSCRADNAVYWFENDGSEVFTAHLVGYVPDARDVEAYDFNQDLDVDIVSSGSSLTYFENYGTDNFTDATPINLSIPTSGSGNVMRGDLDSDGDQDLVYTAEEPSIIWLDNEGGADFTERGVYTSATSSVGVDVADLDGDSFLDIGASMTAYNGVFWFRNLFATDDITCDYPLIFCDNFNYETPLAGKDSNIWNAVKIDSSIEYLFAPINDRMELKLDRFLSPRHLNPSFETDYQINPQNNLIKAESAPVFSTEFKVYPVANNWTYEADDSTFARAVYEIKAVNTTATTQSLYYTNSSGDSNLICSECITMNQWNDIKIIAYFIDSDANRFNSSFVNNSVSVFVTNYSGQISYLKDIPFIDDDAKNQKLQLFEKYIGDKFFIDDYYVYIGIDKLEETIQEFYTDLFTPIEIEGETGDLLTNFETLWDDMGLKSFRSKVFFSLLFIVLLDLILLGLALSGGVKAGLSVGAMIGALGVINFLMMIIFVYLKLLPVWIPILFIILVAGLGALIFRSFAS